MFQVVFRHWECTVGGGPSDSPPSLLCLGNATTILGRTMFSIQQQKKYILHYNYKEINTSALQDISYVLVTGPRRLHGCN